MEPLCILYFKSRGTHQWKEVGRTETILNTLSPEWSQTMVLDYYFEEKQVSWSLLVFCPILQSGQKICPKLKMYIFACEM